MKTMETRPMKTKTVVSRRRWGRGGKGNVLLCERGLMCCLGFALRQIGIRPTVIRNMGMPGDVARADTPSAKEKKALLESPFVRVVSRGAFVNNTALSQQAATINDKEYITDAERERLLTALFKRHGQRIVFKP